MLHRIRSRWAARVLRWREQHAAGERMTWQDIEIVGMFVATILGWVLVVIGVATGWISTDVK